jgi:choline dehydrogenase
LDGEGIYPYFITTRKGQRCSSSQAFLAHARDRPNLTIMTNSMAMRIETADGRAVAVHVMQKGKAIRLAAACEIILSAGAVNSPQILQLSGIGPGAISQRHDIDVVLDQPNVGLHLSDHLGINYYQTANQPTLNAVLGSWPRVGLVGLQYLLQKKGPLSLGVNQLGGLLRARPNAPRPDMQIYINPITYRPAPQGKCRRILPDNDSGFIFSFNACRPYSTGRIEITSPDWRQPPRIDGNYLSDQRDIDDVVAMARLIGKMQESATIKGLLAAPCETGLSAMSDQAIIDDFRERSGTVFHPCGTCRMGPDATHAVVDPSLRVHGIDRLRIADASVFPNITSANLNAPTIMLAHKAAQLILAAQTG